MYNVYRCPHCGKVHESAKAASACCDFVTKNDKFLRGKECPTCKGRGVDYYGRACTTCGGRGTV